MKDFNERARKAQISKGWSHDPTHYQFLRQHDSKLPFVDDQRASHAADAVIGVCALFALFLVSLLLWGGY